VDLVYKETDIKQNISSKIYLQYIYSVFTIFDFIVQDGKILECDDGMNNLHTFHGMWWRYNRMDINFKEWTIFFHFMECDERIAYFLHFMEWRVWYESFQREIQDNVKTTLTDSFLSTRYTYFVEKTKGGTCNNWSQFSLFQN